jgi:hypothetical protein
VQTLFFKKPREIAMQSPKQSQQLSPRQQQWRDEQEQFEASGLTARKFCELNQLNPSTFYKRRGRLVELSVDNVVAAGQKVATFIDAGSIDAAVKSRSRAPELVDSQAPPTLELRIDLGAGIILTLARH